MHVDAVLELLRGAEVSQVVKASHPVEPCSSTALLKGAVRVTPLPSSLNADEHVRVIDHSHEPAEPRQRVVRQGDLPQLPSPGPPTLGAFREVADSLIGYRKTSEPRTEQEALTGVLSRYGRCSNLMVQP